MSYQVIRRLVAGLLDYVGYRDELCAPDSTETFGWVKFDKIISEVVLNSFQIQ